MITEIFLDNIAFIYFFATGNYVPLFMAGILLVLILGSIIYRLTKD